jgi:hypothetical protein
LAPEIPLKKHERLNSILSYKIEQIYCRYKLDALKNQ